MEKNKKTNLIRYLALFLGMLVLLVNMPIQNVSALEPNKQSGTGTMTRQGTSYAHIGRSFILGDNRNHITSLSENDPGIGTMDTTTSARYAINGRVVNTGNGGRRLEGSNYVELASGGRGYFNYSFALTPTNFNRNSTKQGRSLLDNLYSENINKNTLDSILANGSHAWLNPIISVRTASAGHSTMHSGRLWRQGSSNYSVPSRVYTTSSGVINAAWWATGTQTDLRNTFNIKVSLPRIDDFPPTLSFSPNTDQPWKNGNHSLTVTASDAGSGVRTLKTQIYNATTGTWQTAQSQTGEVKNITFSSSGKYKVRATATDNMGNSITTDSKYFHVDKTPPTLSATKSSSSWTNQPVDITLTSNDPHSGVEYIEMLNGGTGDSAIGPSTQWGGGTFTKVGNGIRLKPTSNGQAGIKIPAELFSKNKNYVLSYDIVKHSGTISRIGGHLQTSSTTPTTYINGSSVSGNYSSGVTYPNNGGKHRVEVHFNTNSSPSDSNIYIQPNRGNYGSTYDATISNIRIREAGAYQEVKGVNLLLDSGEIITNNNYGINSYTPSTPLTTGEQYTVTIDITPGKNVQYVAPYLSSGHTHLGRMNVNGTGRQTITHTFTASYTGGREPWVSPNYGNMTVYRFPNDGTTSESTIHRIKVEKGNQSTPWTAAPEDFNTYGRNYVLDSNKTVSGANQNQNFNFSFEGNLNQLSGKYVTVSVDIDLKNGKSGVHNSNRIGFEPSIRFTDGSQLYLGVWHRLSDGANFTGRISNTIKIPDKPISSINQRGIFNQIGGSTVKASNPKIEINDVATPYSTAPEDTNAIRTFQVSQNGTYRFRSSDKVGNSRSTSIAITNIDTTKPTGTVTQSPSNWTNSNVTLTFNGTDSGGSGVKRVRRPNGTWVNGATTTQSVDSNGTYTFIIEDNAGNQTSINHEVTNIDKVVPNGTITGNSSSWVNGNITLTFNATDSGGSGVKRVRKPDGTWVNGSSTSQTVSANGTYTFRVEDNAGNYKDVSATVNRIDKSNPNGSVTQTPTGWTNGNVTLSFNGTDTGGSGVKRVRTPNGNWVNGATATHTATANGTYTFRVEDNAGNIRDISHAVTNIDKVIPAGTITQNPTGWTNGNVTLTFKASDSGGSGVRRVRIKNGTWLSGSTATQTVTSNGTYTFTVEDHAGNSKDVSINVTNIDKINPNISANKSASDWTQGPVNITVSASDGQSGLKNIEMINSPEAGRNVLRLNGKFTGIDRYNGATATVQEGVSVPEWNVTDAARIKTKRGTGDFQTYYTFNPSNSIDWTKVAGEQYTYSVNIRNDGNASIRVSQNGIRGQSHTIEPGESKRISSTGLVRDNPPYNFVQVHFNSEKDMNMVLWGQKMEHGVETNYTPAPEDVPLLSGKKVYPVSANGTYAFRATDNVGNTKDVTVSVDNVDTTSPAVTTKQTPTTWTNEQVDIQVTATDTQSGMRSIEMITDETVNEGRNFVINGELDYSSGYQPGWNTSLNGTLRPNGGWTSGYNSGVLSPSTGYHAHLNISDFGVPTMKFANKNEPYGHKNRWLGISQSFTTSSDLAKELKVGQKVTISFDLHSDVKDGQIYGGLYRTSKSSGNLEFPSQGRVYASEANQWKRVSFSQTVDSNWDFSKPFYIYLYGSSNDGQATKHIKNIKVELGDKGSPFTPIVNSTSSYGKNLILNSNDIKNTSNYLVGTFDLSEPLVSGQKYTVTLKGTKKVSQHFGLWQNGASTGRGHLSHLGDDIYEMTFTAAAPLTGRAESENRQIRIYQPSSSTSGPAAIEWIKLEKGDRATPYSTSPSDNGKSMTRVFTVSSSGTYRFLITDNVGNTKVIEHKVGNIDLTPPTGTVTGNPTNWTNKDVTLKINAKDEGGAGVRRIRLPNGNWVAGATASQVVKSNGIYTFLIEDQAGNLTEIPINVTRIDKVSPSETNIEIDIK